ncbi:hypothetical protein DER45DRAFT_84711 [Fusarium avenaceum]|nr:hypothetical protein DER45DRAFT_84711 [Fusarium avenaceum]
MLVGATTQYEPTCWPCAILHLCTFHPAGMYDYLAVLVGYLLMQRINAWIHAISGGDSINHYLFAGIILETITLLLMVALAYLLMVA